MQEKLNNYCSSHCSKISSAIFVLIIVLALFVGIKALGEFKSYKFIGRDIMGAVTISVSGKGEIFAVPNIANFTFSVREEASNVSEAQKNASKKNNAVIDYLKEKGIDEKDIKTINYSANPVYKYVEKQVTCITAPCFPIRERVISGYEVRQSTSVKIRDTEMAGSILSGVGDLGVSNISGLNFTIEDEDDLRREARAKAIEDAEKKAKELSKDLGVKILGVVNFYESGVGVNYAKAEFGVQSDSFDDGPVAPQISVGENRIVSNITIIYAIR